MLNSLSGLHRSMIWGSHVGLRYDLNRLVVVVFSVKSMINMIKTDLSVNCHVTKTIGNFNKIAVSLT